MTKAITARIIVLNEHNEVLLQKKSEISLNAGGMWELPGGKIGFTEAEKEQRINLGLSLERTSDQAILDELVEEKNIDLREYVKSDPSKLKMLGTMSYSFFHVDKQKVINALVDCYCIKPPSEYLNEISKVGLEEDKLSDFGWFTIGQIEQMEEKVCENSRFYKHFTINFSEY